MAISTSKKVRTYQDEASFYLAPINGRDGRQWWQTMDKDRMRAKIAEFLKSNNVTPETKQKLFEIIEP